MDYTHLIQFFFPYFRRLAQPPKQEWDYTDEIQIPEKKMCAFKKAIHRNFSTPQKESMKDIKGDLSKANLKHFSRLYTQWKYISIKRRMS